MIKKKKTKKKAAEIREFRVCMRIVRIVSRRVNVIFIFQLFLNKSVRKW